jgi:hypothetical protein
MSKTLATAAVALALSVTALTGAAKADEPAYKYPRMIELLTKNQLDQLKLDDPERTKAITSYFAGFTMWIDRSCDFLPMEQFQKVERYVRTMKENGERGVDAQRQLFDIARAGHADAKLFVAEHGCATRTSKAAIATITKVLNS